MVVTGIWAFVSPGRLNWESCTLPSLKKGLVNEYCFGNSNVTFFGVVNKWPSFGTGQCPPIFQDQKVTLEHRIDLRYPTLPFFHGNIFGVSLFRDKIFRTMRTSPLHFSFLRPWWYQAKAWVQGFDVHPKSDAWQQRWKWHRGLGNSRIFDELPIDVISFKDFSHVYTSNLGEMQWVETCWNQELDIFYELPGEMKGEIFGAGGWGWCIWSTFSRETWTSSFFLGLWSGVFCLCCVCIVHRMPRLFHFGKNLGAVCQGPRQWCQSVAVAFQKVGDAS